MHLTSLEATVLRVILTSAVYIYLTSRPWFRRFLLHGLLRAWPRECAQVFECPVCAFEHEEGQAMPCCYRIGCGETVVAAFDCDCGNVAHACRDHYREWLSRRADTFDGPGAA